MLYKWSQNAKQLRKTVKKCEPKGRGKLFSNVRSPIEFCSGYLIYTDSMITFLYMQVTLKQQDKQGDVS